MKVSLQELSQLGRKMNVEIAADDVSAAFNRIYQSIQRDVSIKGFRKGKAPLPTIRTLYKDKVKGDVINELIQTHYFKALDEHSLDPVNMPKFDVSTVDEGQPFKFTAEFEVRPEVKLKDYVGLSVQKEKFEADPKYVSNVLENIQKSHASREAVLEDRAAQKGDIVEIDFEGFRDNQPVPNTKAEKFELELGSSSFIPGFEEGLEGIRAGQSRDLNLTFPTDYHSKDLAGSSITFKVFAHGLKKSVLPELNDEFAKRVGFETLEKLKENILEDYTKGEEKRVNDEFKNRLLKALVDKNPVTVPDSMLQEQREMIIKDVQGRMQQQGMGEREFQEYVQKWDSDFTQSASFMIQSSFLVHAIAEKESLAANEDDFNAKLEEYAKQTGLDVSKLRGFYSDRDQKSRLMYRITEDKVVDFLKDKAKVVEVPKSALKDA